MGFLDAILPSLALTALRVVGASAQLQRMTAGGYNAALGTTASTSPTLYDVVTAPPEQYATRLLDGSNILAGDLKFQIAAASCPVVPDPTQDRLVFNGVAFKIIAVTIQYAQNAAVLYDVQGRR